MAFAEALGVDHVHHVPDDDETGSDPGAGRAAMEATKTAIRAAGFTIGPELSGGCSRVHEIAHRFGIDDERPHELGYG
ncbi:hypothetical protein [Streptomyces sp. NPDC050856]|uniref:hypothetical protein n=1 Tax=Streptomyces sp. NPDC050856 TaxID=3154939 RepID=UPI0033FDA276